MSITYDAGTNTITVTGYSIGTPCNFTDIYNADVAGGWGVVSKQDNAFTFNCDLRFGDGSIATFCTDVNKFVYFGSYHLTLDNCTLTLGELLPGGNKLTKNGCTLSWSPASQYDYFMTSVDSNINLYSSVISSDIHHWGVLSYTQAADVKFISYNSYFNDLTYIWYDGTASAGDEMYRSVMQDILFTFFHYGVAFAYFEDNIITGLCIAYQDGRDFTYTNLINVGDGYGPYYFWIYRVVDSNVYLIDTQQTLWNFYWQGTNTNTKVYRQYTFNLKVTDKEGNNINGASVKIWDKDDNLVVDTTTASGVIAEQTITRGYYNQANGNTLQDASPHTVQISEAGYQTYSKKFTLDKTNWEIRLKRISINIDSEVLN